MERNGIVRAASSAMLLLLAVISSAALTAHAASAATVRLARPAVLVTVFHQVHHSARVSFRLYTVKSGDSLSEISRFYCGVVNDWTGIYEANRRTIGSNPNLIFPGQIYVLKCYDPPALLRLGVQSATHTARRDGDGDYDHDNSDGTVAHITTPTRTVGYNGTLSGTLSFAELMLLWEAAGGNPAYATTAACIAEHESGGNQYAHSPTDDFGYWQINGSHGSLATYDAYGNARAAVIISSNGTDWSPWTTHYMCGV